MGGFLLEEVQATFGRVVALEVDRLEIPGGGVSVLLGPNGSGKTTMLRLMAGLHPPARGRVSYAGALVSYGRAGLAHRRRVTLLAQDPFLFRGKVLANVAYGPKARGGVNGEAERAARAAMAAAGCDHLAARGAASLSGGERKRVALARSLATGAETLLLDEPEAGLDEEHSGRLRETIVRLAASGKTIVLSTHHADWIDSVADRRLRLAYGRIVPSG
ncbi:MAG: ABC transporter ATP-binding protein [bacterium]